ncbi:hypothetical protein LCGC14_1970820 [marine sediment metagenome]|uniref:Uncharacterized protein n=1 Tax=marine sediment metagenome TaxID=412755 RepID=A0A0F9FBZ6_9ZZZZ
MVKTLEDVERVAEIVDRLRKLGIPEKTCIAIDGWNKKQEGKLAKELSSVSI